MSPRLLEFEQPVIELAEKIRQFNQFTGHPAIGPALKKLEQVAQNVQQMRFQRLSSWEQFCLARHPERPYTLDYINGLLTDFVELKGDRLFGEDPSIIAGIGCLVGQSVAVVGQQKGRSTKENIARHFGMAMPEGYRKCQRIMRLAEQFNIPIISFIDTSGAYPGIAAEERGQSQAIAACIELMLGLKVPTIAIVIGEGGSGGALAIGTSDRILMLEHAVYSVISPRGCAAILWKDPQAERKAAEQLHMTAKDWLKLGICDGIIPEAMGGAHRGVDTTVATVKDAILNHLKQLQILSSEVRLQKRYEKFRRIGHLETERVDCV